jgi:DNA-binding NtrC family response regulator
MAEILVVDDEIGIRELLSEILGDEGHEVLTAENARQARELRDENRLDLVLLDIWMPDTDGITLLKEWASSGKLTMPVIMMSGHATIDTAVEATRIGAIDFLEKPITMQKLLTAVETGLQRGRATAQAQRSAPSFAPSVGAYVPVRPLGDLPGLASSAPPVAALTAGASFAGGLALTAGGTPSGGEGLVVGSDLGAGAALPAVSLTDEPGHLPGENGPLGADFDDSADGLRLASERSSAGLPASLALRDLPLDAPLREARDAFERAYFEHHLAREHGSMTRVAERTGLERTHLYRKLKQLGIDLSRGAWRKPGGA